MKKIIIFILLLVTVQISYANFSIGFSFMGVGSSNPRFAYTRTDDPPLTVGDLKGAVSWTPAAQIFFVFQPLSAFAIETGVGYGTSQAKLNIADTSYIIKKNEIRVPIMLRYIFNFGGPNLYISSGIKFGIPLTPYFEGDNIVGLPVENSDFTLDVGIALGFEIPISAIYSFIGIRMDYDINIISPIKKEEIFCDQFGFSVYIRIPII